MWQPWSEALKLYYNCFLEEWMARGFVNNLPLEVINEEALVEQGVPPFLSNKHFVDRHRANLMTKHPDFYEARVRVRACVCARGTISSPLLLVRCRSTSGVWSLGRATTGTSTASTF